MFKDIIIGQYVPGNSPLHKMNPPVKIIMTILYIVLLFILKNPISYVVFTIYTITLILISGVPFKMILKGLKPMLWIFIFTAVLNVFMTPGDTVWALKIFKFTLKITKEGIESGSLMVIRLLYLVMGTSLLTLTTSPLQLTDGIEKLLKPFNKIKVPSHEIAMMMTIAIRFIPTLAEETDKIMKAQMARGADFETGNIIRRAKAMIPLLVPLFVNAFRRADELATAMEARCYNGGNNRTKMKETHMTKVDLGASIVFVLAAAIMRNIKLKIQYDGTDYHGWQIQKNDITVQETVKKAVQKIVNEDVHLTGCGRTDTGVHAENYVCNFFTNSRIPSEKLPYALNTYLPNDIVCFEAEDTDENFHSNSSAVKKRYVYKILNREFPDVVMNRYSWHYKYPLDIEKMRIAAKAFIGEHDFIGFASSGFSVKTTVREIYSLDVDKNGDIITIDVVGNGFLYNMVRIIAGTLVFVGGGKINPNDMTDIINSKDRERAGITAPPQGLCLKEVYY